MHAQSLESCPLFATPYTVTHQAPLSMRFCRQEYWNRLPFPSPGDLPDPGIEPASPASPALHASGFFTREPPQIICVKVLLSCGVLSKDELLLLGIQL